MQGEDGSHAQEGRLPALHQSQSVEQGETVLRAPAVHGHACRGALGSSASLAAPPTPLLGSLRLTAAPHTLAPTFLQETMAQAFGHSLKWTPWGWSALVPTPHQGLAPPGQQLCDRGPLCLPHS